MNMYFKVDAQMVSGPDFAQRLAVESPCTRGAHYSEEPYSRVQYAQ